MREHKVERHAQGFYLQGAVRGHAVLPPGLGAVAAGDLRWAGTSESELRHLGLPCPTLQGIPPWPKPTESSSRVTVPEHVLSTAGSEPLGRRAALFRFKNKLLSLDATLIELWATVFDWAEYRGTKGAAEIVFYCSHFTRPRSVVHGDISAEGGLDTEQFRDPSRT